jgi:protein-disulfide isomerase
MRGCTFKPVVTASVFAVLSLALGGASCDKKSVANPSEPGPAVPFEAPSGNSPAAQAKPAAPAAPAAAAAPAPAPADKDARLNALLEKLPSPCGKAMSLKKTLESDPGCAKGPFAKKFVARLVSLEVRDDDIAQVYGNRYGNAQSHTFNLKDTPFIGSPSAPVTLVEFYDYACPHCREAMPILEEVVSTRTKDVALYYKHFPLHKESLDAAKAAIAAYRQGKFEAMHHKLFANQGAQSRDDLFGYAKEIGLDMGKFEKDFNDPAVEARVKADKDEGQKTNMQGTPTIFIDGRMFMDAVTADSLNDWVDEELAVNR